MLPRRLGAWCATHLLRLAADFTLERYFTWWGLTRLFRRAGLEWRLLPPGLATKLVSGDRPNAPAWRWMARVARLPPGDVRELENYVRRVVVLESDESVAAELRERLGEVPAALDGAEARRRSWRRRSRS